MVPDRMYRRSNYSSPDPLHCRFTSVGRFLVGQEEEEVTGERKGGAEGIEKNFERLDPTFVTDWSQ